MDALQFIRHIAIDGGIPAQDLPPINTTNFTIHTGPRRLVTGNARLMVFRTLAQLHKCGPDDWQHLCDLICIIGLGLPVVVASTWRLAGGEPAKLAARASGVVLHEPAVRFKPCTFLVHMKYKNSDPYPEPLAVLHHCTTRPNSKWKMSWDKGQPLAKDAVKIPTMSALPAAILNLRTLPKGAEGCPHGYSMDHR